MHMNYTRTSFIFQIFYNYYRLRKKFAS